MKRSVTALLIVTALVLGAVALPAVAETQWKDVRLRMEPSRYATAAVFDPLTRRIFVTMPNPFQTSMMVAAYKPGRTRPVWDTQFAPAPEGSEDEFSFSNEILVMPKRHRLYVGGGLTKGLGSGPFTSSGYVYAFDTRTGKKVWSHTEPIQPGLGSHYHQLTYGPKGSVIAVSGKLIASQQNSSGSYAYDVSSFGPSGRELWRWTDSIPGGARDIATTKAGLVVLIGTTSIDGWQHAYRLALGSNNGSVKWQHVTEDATQVMNSVALDHDGQTLYIAGEDHDGQGSDATLRALSTKTGRFKWTQSVDRPFPPRSDREYYYSATRVTASRRGPCAAGTLAESDTVAHEPVLPDDGFVACYSPEGKRRWIDRLTGGPSNVMRASGDRLLWSGRQEVKRADSSIEVLRYATRSLRSGKIRESSSKRYRTIWYDSSEAILVFVQDGRVHFVTSMTHERHRDGSLKHDPWLFTRIFQ